MEMRAWLDARRPPAPPGLASAVVEGVVRMEALPTDAPEGRSVGDVLLASARERLDAARARPGRVRRSALDLLAADALITYACEAALESEDPVNALQEIFLVGSRR